LNQWVLIWKPDTAVITLFALDPVTFIRVKPDDLPDISFAGLDYL